MTAQATGTTTTTTKVEPMDIVLVLDQSGSMADDFGNGTRQSAMKAAVNSFIGEVADKYSPNADHRMAIVTFGTNARILAGWTSVDEDGEAALTGEISGLTDSLSGATNVGAGMQMAKNLMDSDAYTGGNTDRQKTVIVFTDGVPTTSSDFDTTGANIAISAAKDMKGSGVTIYTVGIFTGAKPEQLYGDSGFDNISDGTVGSNWSDFSFWMIGDIQNYDVPAGNRFLNYLSSNFESAAKIGLKPYKATFLGIGYRGWEITQNFKRTSSDYYKTAADASSLKNIFKVISNIVPAPGDPALDEKTVITDTLSDYFTFAGTAEDVKVYAIDANGNEKESGDAAKVKPVVTGKTVTGFLSKYYVGSDDAETLVIKIKVKPSGVGCASASIPTNEGNAAVTLDKKEIVTAESPTVGGYSVEYAIGDGATWPNNGNGPATLYYPQGAAVPVTDSEPTREGWEFRGWKITAPKDGETTLQNGKFTMPAADVTLTAQWTESKYKVTYALTDDVKPTGYNVPTDSGEYTKDSKYTVDPTHKEDEKVVDGGYTYTFSGWKLNGAGAVLTGEQAMGNESVVLKGTWTRTVNKYTVTYEYTGTAPADAPDVPAAAQHEYGAEVTIENVPTLTGYTFHGWTLPEGLTANDGKFTMPAKNVTITGYWTKNIIPTYTFDLSNLNTIKVNKEFVSKYGRSATMSFEATATIEKEKAYIITDSGINTNASNSAAAAKSDYTKVFEAAGMVTLKTGTTDVFKFSGKYDLEPGAYRITVKEAKGSDRYYVTYDDTTYTYDFTVNDKGEISIKTPITCTFTNKYTKRHSAATPSKPTLNTGDHYAYVMGYPDGTVRPNGSITRAEVSTILFRLLSDKTRDEYFTTESSFTDVKAGAWYNNSIATLEKAGVIVDTAKGGAFRPNEAITRAELAAMLAQFSDAKPVKGVKFSDVSAEHWAYEAIAIAAKMGWIEGYPDGTFRPDATITRAEMMTLVNRALERVPSDEDHLLSKRVMLTFPDCKSGDWFYIAVQEATNSHTYERAATEKNGDEQWTALRANRDWTLLEK